MSEPREIWEQARASDIMHYDSYRKVFRPASAEVVRAIFSEYIEPHDRILEVGSGLGELVFKLIPKYADRIQQTEPNQHIFKAHKKKHYNSNVKVANVYELPFGDNEYDITVCYSVLDTLCDLPKALKEIKRVSKRLIHFLDVMASPNTVFHHVDYEEAVPFPLYELNSSTQTMEAVGLQLVKRGDIIKYIAKVANSEMYGDKILAAYLLSPEETYLDATTNKEVGLTTLGALHRMVEKAHIITSPLRFNGYFKNNLKTHLGDCQYRIKLKKDLTRMATVTRNPQLHTPKVNAVFNDLGIQRETFSSKLASELGKNKVKILSKLYVVVADRIE